MVPARNRRGGDARIGFLRLHLRVQIVERVRLRVAYREVAHTGEITSP